MKRLVALAMLSLLAAALLAGCHRHGVKPVRTTAVVQAVEFRAS